MERILQAETKKITRPRHTQRKDGAFDNAAVQCHAVVGLCDRDILSGPAPLNSVLATPSETACACGCRVRACVCVRVQCMHVCTRVQCACVHVHVHVCAFLKHLKIRPGKVPSAEHRAEDPAPARGTMAAGAGRPFSD